MNQARTPRLLAISDRSSHPGSDLSVWIQCIARAGVDSLQIREKDLPDNQLLAIAQKARALVSPPTRLLINGRIDIATAAEADGVHLPSDGVPIAAIRRRFGSEPILGLSTHRLAEIEGAAEAGVDYVTYGPVYPTPGKERYGQPTGLEGLRRAVGIGVPVLALGGVTIERLPELAAAGAFGAAGIRLFLDPTDVEGVVAAAACFDAGREPRSP